MNNRKRLTARDYKGARPGQLDLRRWKEFGIGLGVGLLVALVVFISDRKHAQAMAQALAERDPAAQHDGGAPKGGRARSPSDAAADSVSDAAASSGAGSYDFYKGLQKFEVVVPEKEHGTRVEAGAKVARPGTYILQVGSYPNKAAADRACQLLARQDIVASVQRVQLDATVWFRVRIGPIKDLAQLNATRDKLRTADFEPLVISLGD